MPIKPLILVASVGGAAVAGAIGVNIFLWQDDAENLCKVVPEFATAGVLYVAVKLYQYNIIFRTVLAA